jgi:hypothetical protein
MYTQRKDHKDTNRSSVASSLPKSKSNDRQYSGFVDNRPLSSAYQLLSSIGQQPTVVAQRMLVAQLATRKSSAVRFNGSAFQLRNLILQWGPPNGTQVLVEATDYVGGMYTVRFTNNGGPPIKKNQADDWVQQGIAHFQEDSNESESLSDSE